MSGTSKFPTITNNMTKMRICDVVAILVPIKCSEILFSNIHLSRCSDWLRAGWSDFDSR
jgi:hypothetical protein